MTQVLNVNGHVVLSTTFHHGDLHRIESKYQIPDVSVFDPNRRGRAVRLAGLLQLVGAKPEADYLTLHATKDDFHASIPLADVRDKAVLIYELDGQPLPASAGGPFRFFIPDHASCKTHEVDECANVKFVDRLELTVGKGQDNRPADEKDHAALHQRQA